MLQIMEYSDNPAYVFRDYVKNVVLPSGTFYGATEVADNFDEEIEKWADYCNELIEWK